MAEFAHLMVELPIVNPDNIASELDPGRRDTESMQDGVPLSFPA